jgi:hypothetical protein
VIKSLKMWKISSMTEKEDNGKMKNACMNK